MQRQQREESIFDVKVDVFGLETTGANIVAIFCGIIFSLCILFCAAHYNIKMGFKTVNQMTKSRFIEDGREEKQPLLQADQCIVIVNKVK